MPRADVVTSADNTASKKSSAPSPKRLQAEPPANEAAPLQRPLVFHTNKPGEPLPSRSDGITFVPFVDPPFQGQRPTPQSKPAGALQTLQTENTPYQRPT